MSGHSKWSTIKHKKAAEDKKRGKLFTQAAKEITLAARESGGDPEFNPRLRLAIDKAKAVNMPKDNIERAIKRGTGELEGDELFELMYESYAPHGVGLLIEVVTDNKNRTVADIRSVLNKAEGTMASSGSVSWQFTRQGFIVVKGFEDPDELFLVAADAGADDVEFENGTANVYCDPSNTQDVRDALEEAGWEVTDVQLVYEPDNPMTLDVKSALQVMGLIERLDDLDDVQNVYSTLNLDDEVMAALEAAD